MVKTLSAIWVQSPDREDPLEEGVATHSSIGESHGQRSLAGYSPWGCKESDMTEQLKTTTTMLLSRSARGQEEAHLLKLLLFTDFMTSKRWMK